MECLFTGQFKLMEAFNSNLLSKTVRQECRQFQSYSGHTKLQENAYHLFSELVLNKV